MDLLGNNFKIWRCPNSEQFVTGILCADKSVAETGYELRPEYQGKGIMHEAISRVIDFWV